MMYDLPYTAIGSQINAAPQPTEMSQQESDPMSFHDTLSLPAGNVAFQGTVHVGGDGTGAFAFRIDLPNRHPMYGQWAIVPEEDPNKWNVAIVRFGYLSKDNVGNPHPDALKPVSEQERKAVEELTRALFSTPNVRDKYFPFKSGKSGFLGSVTLADGWIRQLHQ